MESGHITGPDNVAGDDRLALEDAVAMSNQLLSRPAALEEANLYLNDLEVSSPALFKIIADGANEISAMLFHERDSEGRLWYRCVQCGKLWDRWNRARDCRNSDLKLRPYNCRGECGHTSCTKAYASEEVLDRHRKSGSEKVDCSNCDAQVLKQNISRHMKSCMKGL